LIIVIRFFSPTAAYEDHASCSVSNLCGPHDQVMVEAFA
jgi:hypothetical protein